MKNPYIATLRDGKPRLTCIKCGNDFASELSNFEDAEADVLKKCNEHNCASGKKSDQEVEKFAVNFRSL